LKSASAARNPSVLAQILSKRGEVISGVTCDFNGLSKLATRAFQQEVVSLFVSDDESQQSKNG
jgi:hypothetical protein